MKTQRYESTEWHPTVAWEQQQRKAGMIKTVCGWEGRFSANQLHAEQKLSRGSSKIKFCLFFPLVEEQRPVTFQGRRIRPSLLKVNHHTTLDFLHQRLQTLIQHPLRENTVRTSCKTQRHKHLHKHGNVMTQTQTNMVSISKWFWCTVRDH